VVAVAALAIGTLVAVAVVFASVTALDKVALFVVFVVAVAAFDVVTVAPLVVEAAVAEDFAEEEELLTPTIDFAEADGIIFLTGKSPIAAIRRAGVPGAGLGGETETEPRAKPGGPTKKSNSDFCSALPSRSSIVETRR